MEIRVGMSNELENQCVPAGPRSTCHPVDLRVPQRKRPPSVGEEQSRQEDAPKQSPTELLRQLENYILDHKVRIAGILAHFSNNALTYSYTWSIAIVDSSGRLSTCLLWVSAWYVHAIGSTQACFHKYSVEAAALCCFRKALLLLNCVRVVSSTL